MKMKTIFNYATKMVLAIALLVGSACTSGLDDNLQNPAALSPDQASNEYIYNTIQLGLANFFLNTTDFGQDNTRMRAMFGSTYENAYGSTSFDGVWTSSYSDMLVNAKLLLSKTANDPAATTNPYNPFYQGTVKVMMAYTVLTLVDFFGKIPYTEALDPTIIYPKQDDDAAVYDAAKTMLEDAITDLTAVTSATQFPALDLYYSPSGSTPSTVNALKWRKVAKTLLFKLHLNRRLIDVAGSTAALNALTTEGDMILSSADDFKFAFPANSQSNPNTYHPWFYGSYLVSSGPYLSNSYMKELYDGKGLKDPRIRYYFYRQVTTENVDVNNLTCSIPTYPYVGNPPAHYPPGTAYCQLPEGYWGRDHLSAEGTPPDGLLKTTYGLYPAGGRFDANDAKPVDDQKLASGAKGKGILPIMMSSFTLFMQAEAALMLNSNVAGARALLDQATRASISTVLAFNSSVVNASFVPSATGINNYVNAVLVGRYDAASTDDERLDVIIKEYWVALWGNGIEAYNMVRRTGKPSNLQPALSPNPGNFYRSFTYPAVYVFRNGNSTQKPDDKVKVFWDNNPDGFVK